MNPEFLATALVDQKLHSAAVPPQDVDGFEREVLKAYDFPKSADPTMRAVHAFHTFSREYAANVYTYLWSDILAADLAEVFLRSKDGLHSREVGEAFMITMLGQGNVTPIDQAYRRFHGRAPDETALIRRYGLGEKKNSASIPEFSSEPRQATKQGQ